MGKTLTIIAIALLLAALLCAQNPNTAKYPTAIAADLDLLVAKDRSYSYLSAGIDDATLTIPVNSGTQFLAPTVVLIGEEQILICTITVNDLNACAGGRGWAGTTPASHSSGAYVGGERTAWHHNQSAAELKAIETALGISLVNVVPSARTVSTTSPLAGGGALSGNLTLTCTTCEVTGQKGVASGYEGLTAGTKLTFAHGQEVWALADLSDVTAKRGDATTVQMASGAVTVDHCAKFDTTGNTVDAGAACGVGGGGTPGGSDTQMQYNNAGAFGGTSGLTWSNADGRIVFSNTPPVDSAKALWLFGTPMTGAAGGTYLTVNAPAGFTGDILRFGLDGLTKVYIDYAGNINTPNGGITGYNLWAGASGIVGFNGRSKWLSDSDGWFRASNNAGTNRASLDILDLKHAGGTEGACNSGNRGWIVNTQPGSGVKDSYRICRKDESDVYAFEDLMGGGTVSAFDDLSDFKTTMAGAIVTLQPGIYRLNGTPTAFPDNATITKTGTDTGTFRIFLDYNAGMPIRKCVYGAGITIGNYTLVNITCASGSAFPANSVPLSTVDIVAGTWQPPVNFRSSQSLDVYTAGAGLGQTGRAFFVDPAAYPTVVGSWNAGDATDTTPAKRGTSLPATCTVGQQYYKTDATPGSNLYGCTATNVWTVLSGGGGGDGGGAANYSQSFTAQTSVALAHNLGTKNVLVTCLDASDQQIDWHTLTVDTVAQATVTFGFEQTGRCVVNGNGIGRYAADMSGQTIVTITGATHNLQTADLSVTVWDAGSPRKRVEPDSVTVDITSKDVVVTFAVAQSGRIVIN